MENEPKAFLPPVPLSGQLTVKGIDVQVSGNAWAGIDGRLQIDLNQQVLNGESRAALHQSFGRPGQLDQQFSLNATSPDGATLSSNRVSLTSIGTDVLEIALDEATVTVPLESPVIKPCMIMWLRGIRNFGPTYAETQLGQLELRAGIQNIQPDDVSGYLVLEADEPNVDAEWRRSAENLLMFMRAGLALAHGGRLQNPVLEIYDNDHCEANFYAGRGSQPEFKVQHPIHMRPYFEALARRYFDVKPWPDSLWIAQGWMHVETTHDEVRFLGAMTALETLVEALPQKKTTVIPKPDFNPLRDSLLTTLKQWPDGSESEFEIYRLKICQLNQASLRQKLVTLIEFHDVSADDLLCYIPALISERNEIVHRGMAKALTLDLIIVVREIVTRLVLKALRYEGPYLCYLGGRHTREFPSCTPQ